jgi:hypothetical protein
MDEGMSRPKEQEIAQAICVPQMALAIGSTVGLAMVLLILSLEYER